jgi:hypothetical protein
VRERECERERERERKREREREDFQLSKNFKEPKIKVSTCLCQSLVHNSYLRRIKNVACQFLPLLFNRHLTRYSKKKFLPR